MPTLILDRCSAAVLAMYAAIQLDPDCTITVTISRDINGEPTWTGAIISGDRMHELELKSFGDMKHEVYRHTTDVAAAIERLAVKTVKKLRDDV